MMKKYMMMVLMTILCGPMATAQSLYKSVGTCGTDVKWEFDGFTLRIMNISKVSGQTVAMEDYNVNKTVAPWVKKKLNVSKVVIESGITRIGSCAFANCHDLQEVVFEGTDLKQIGWGAFLNCSHLRTISLPVQLRSIETIAFANCISLTSAKVPDQCRVGDQAFASCTKLNSIELSPTAILGHYVFASEVVVDNRVRHSLYNGEILRIPSYININNCHEYGIAPEAYGKVRKTKADDVDYDYMTADVDSFIPTGMFSRNNVYALVIGNQNYRFASDVPYAIHDARVFADYCKKVLGIPADNIHISEDATKQMILEEELEDWVGRIGNREEKKLIVYYAGHGVPDVKDHNKPYMLPVDVRGTNPKRGISLDDFYAKLGEFEFKQTSVFLDACFSGVNRDNEGVSEGLRAVEIDADEASLGNGALVVFSAAQGNETAQGYPKQGHGLFTYYLLKAIQDTNGDVSFGDLSDDVSRNVSKQAKNMNMRKSQTPTTNASDQISTSWRSMRF